MQPFALKRVATIAYKANSVVREQLVVSGKIRALFLLLTGVVTVTDVTNIALRNRTPGVLVPSVSVLLNGQTTIHQGRWNDYRDRMAIFSALPNDTAPGITAAAHTFLARARVDIAAPWWSVPYDTLLDVGAGRMFDRLDLEVLWGAETSLIYLGTKSFTTNPTITVLADVMETAPAARPWGMYRTAGTDSTNLGTSANTSLNLVQPIGPRVMYHHLALVAEDDVANLGRNLVATALNDVRLYQSGPGESSDVIGPISGTEIQQEFDSFGRSVDGPQTGIYPVTFAPRYDGMAAYLLQTQKLDNLRYLINHDAFTTAGYLRTLAGWIEPLS